MIAVPLGPPLKKSVSDFYTFAAPKFTMPRNPCNSFTVDGLGKYTTAAMWAVIGSIPATDNAACPKHALLDVDNQATLPEACEELLKVDSVLLRVLAGHVHVIDVGEHRLQVGDSPVDLSLKGGLAFMRPKSIRRYSKRRNAP